jgi:uncharacterized protein YkwD
MAPLTSLLSILAVSALTLAMPSTERGIVARATPEEIDQYLAGHNDERAKHNAAPLVWNEEAAAKAQQWADACVFEHSGGQLGSYGGKYF